VCRKFVRTSFFDVQFWYLVVLQTVRISMIVKPQKAPPTHSPSSKQKGRHFKSFLDVSSVSVFCAEGDLRLHRVNQSKK